MKKRLFTLLGLCLIAATTFYTIKSTDTPTTDLYSVVPPDALYIIEVDDPINTWEDFGKSSIWQYLQTNTYLAAANASIDTLKVTLAGKERLLKYILQDKLLISAHLTTKNTYDYLYSTNLSGLSNITQFAPLMQQVFQQSGYTVSKYNYQDKLIYQLADPETNDILYVSFKESTLIAAYTRKIVEKALSTAQKGKTYFTENNHFTELQYQLGHKGLSNIFISYKTFNDLVNCYTSPSPKPAQVISDMLTFSGLNLQLHDKYLEMQGKSLLNDKQPSYLKALLEVNEAETKAHHVLPANTSFLLSLCFDDFEQLKKGLDALQTDTTPSKGIQGMINKEVEKEMTKWINNEIALAMVPTATSSATQAYVAVIPTGNKKGQIAKKIDRLLVTINQFNPTSLFTNEDKKTYKNYRLVRLPVEKIMRKIGGGILSDLKKPYMVLIDEYLVFCDDLDILKKTIDAYESKKTLAQNTDYKQFFSYFKRKTNVYTYIQTQKIYPYLMAQASASSKQALQDNKGYFASFPHLGFQLYPKQNMYETFLHADFKAIDQKSRGNK